MKQENDETTHTPATYRMDHAHSLEDPPSERFRHEQGCTLSVLVKISWALRMVDSAGMSIRSYGRMSTPPRLLEPQSSLVRDPTLSADLNRGSVSTTRDRM